MQWYEMKNMEDRKSEMALPGIEADSANFFGSLSRVGVKFFCET